MPAHQQVVLVISREILHAFCLDPPAKKAKTEVGLAGWLAKGTKQEEFLKDLTRAFASSNVPLSKLAKDAPMRKLFEKYMVLDGGKVVIVDPINLRGTWLPKVWKEGVRKLGDLIRDGEWFVAICADETDDPRSDNDFIVTVDVCLCCFVLRVSY